MKHIPSIWSLLFMLWLFSMGFSAQPIFPKPLSPRIANYTIDVRYLPELKMLNGKEVLIWHNTSKEAIGELQFHLYLNAFRNNRTTFMKESGGVHRGFKIDEKKGWGFIEIWRMVWVRQPEDVYSILSMVTEKSPGVTDLSDRMEFIQPDDGNPEDKTVLRVQLPKPLAPGDSIVLRIDFVARLPQPPFARTGAWKEYVFAGQWFPKIGVYTAKGWNCHQFHYNSEFFADFGVYDVFITVPADYVVGATGLEYDVQQTPEGQARHYFHAEDVHDFAWTASPEFVEFKDHTQDVDIRLLMQPDHVDQAERHMRAAKAAVEHFQNWYGDYPFPNLTVVDPRRGARGSGGMEYPTLITAGTAYGMPQGLRFVEAVIIHEFGHQFWYHLLASNEFEESWLDEGINSYTEAQIMHDLYGPEGDMIDFLGLKINDIQFQRSRYISFADLDPVVRPAWLYYSGTSYGVNSYSRPAVLLTTLQNYLGWNTMLKVMQTYVSRYRFTHPTSQDFIKVASEVSGQDLSWFFDQALFSTRTLDYSASYLISKKVKKPQGYDFTLFVKQTLKEAGLDTGRIATYKQIVPEDWSEDTTLYYSEARIRRKGQFRFPVDVQLVFSNGDTLRDHWDGQDPWKKYVFIRPDRLLEVQVDPEQKILLDRNWTNNSLTLRPYPRGILKQTFRFLFATQFLLDQPEWLGLTRLLPFSF